MTKTTRYRIGSGLVPFSPCTERFVGQGYRDPMPLDRQIELMASVDGIRGIALDYPAQFTEADLPRVKELLFQHELELATLELGIYCDRKWKLGSLTSADPGVRRVAIEMSKRGLGIARELGATDVLLWAGQDGFDYPFQVDYDECWNRLIEGVGELASDSPDVRIAIEYKPKEPRANCFIRNAGTLLYLLQCVDMPNVGATIDFGHSLVAGENPAEAAALFIREQKLFQVHLNDNYRDWDQDLIVGGISFWETLEFLYWIEQSGYDGWYLMDVFPYREDGKAAIQQCVRNTEKLLDMVRTIPRAELQDALSRMDYLASSRLLWGRLLAE